ncbi:MAG: HAD family hydrolase [Candidatus Bipolaricaulia bacterium]
MKGPSSVDVVFFDVHGTLIQQYYSPPEIFRRLCAEAGFDVPLATIQAAYPPLTELAERSEATSDDTDAFWRQVNAEILAELGVADSDGALAEHLMTGFKRADWWVAYDDAIPTLEKLREAGFRLGTIANARHLVLGRLRHAGLIDRFETITYSEDIGHQKPDARLFNAALGRLGVSAANAVHVGDRVREDVQGAQNAGLRAILIDREDRHSSVDGERVRSLAELRPLLTGVPREP